MIFLFQLLLLFCLLIVPEKWSHFQTLTWYKKRRLYEDQLIGKIILVSVQDATDVSLVVFVNALPSPPPYLIYQSMHAGH